MYSQHSPTPDEFAELVAESLINRGSHTGQLVFDRHGFALLLKDQLGRPNKRIFLSQFYREYCSGDIVDREKVLLRAAGIGSAGGISPFGLSESKFIPQIRDRWSAEKTRLEQMAQARTVLTDDWAGSLHQPATELIGVFARHFCVQLTLDSADSMLYLTADHLSHANLSFADAVSNSVAAISARSNFRFDSLVHADTDEVILHSMTWQGKHCAPLLNAEQIEKLKVTGEHLIFLIHPNYMIVTGSECERGLMYAYSELRSAHKETHILPPFPILLKNGQYSRFKVPPTSLWHHFFREMELRYVSNLCRWQKELLVSKYGQLVAGCDVVDYELAKTEQGKKFSYCAISDRRLPALVPLTDYIYFQNRNGRAAAGSLSRIRQIAPELFETTDFYPTRLLINHFPTAEQLRQIGSDEIFA